VHFGFATGAGPYEIANNNLACQIWRIISAKEQNPSLEERNTWYDLTQTFHICNVDSAYVERTSLPLRHLWSVTVKTQNSQSLTSTSIAGKKTNIEINWSVCYQATWISIHGHDLLARYQSLWILISSVWALLEDFPYEVQTHAWRSLRDIGRIGIAKPSLISCHSLRQTLSAAH
jgi:hypothetical protein